MSYLKFNEESSLSGKTKVVTITNSRSSYQLGEIKWHSHWRRYCFFPLRYTIFDHECLEEIGWKIDSLQSEREDEKRINKEDLDERIKNKTTT